MTDVPEVMGVPIRVLGYSAAAGHIIDPAGVTYNAISVEGDPSANRTLSTLRGLESTDMDYDSETLRVRGILAEFGIDYIQ